MIIWTLDNGWRVLDQNVVSIIITSLTIKKENSCLSNLKNIDNYSLKKKNKQKYARIYSKLDDGIIINEFYI